MNETPFKVRSLAVPGVLNCGKVPEHPVTLGRKQTLWVPGEQAKGCQQQRWCCCDALDEPCLLLAAGGDLLGAVSPGAYLSPATGAGHFWPVLLMPQTLFCPFPPLTSSLPLFQGCLRMHRLLSQTSQGCQESALLCLCQPSGLRT